MLIGFVSVLAAAGLTILDQLIKMWATAELMPVGSMSLIPHVVELYYLQNEGKSISMLSGKRGLLIAVTGVSLAVMAVMLLVRWLCIFERVA